jgi:hypothetical protein
VLALSELFLYLIYCLIYKKSVFYKFLNYFVIKVTEKNKKGQNPLFSLIKIAGKTTGTREWIG